MCVLLYGEIVEHVLYGCKNRSTFGEKFCTNSSIVLRRRKNERLCMRAALGFITFSSIVHTFHDIVKESMFIASRVVFSIYISI